MAAQPFELLALARLNVDARVLREPAGLCRAAVDMKVLIEQMREQVQNVE